MKDLIIGSHVWIARMGSTVDAVVVSSAALPVFADTKADWTKLGSIEHWSPKITKTEVRRRAPVAGGGRYDLRKKFILSSLLTHAFGLQEFGALEMEMLFNADGITAGTGAFVPNSRTEEIEAWLHLENYDQDDNLIVSSDILVSLSIDSYQFAEKLDPHTVMAELLSSDLNAGVLTNLT